MTRSSFLARPSLAAPVWLLLLAFAALAQPPAEGTISLDGLTRVRIAAFGRISVEPDAPGGALHYRWIGTPAVLAVKSSGAWRIISATRKPQDPMPGELRVALPASLVQAFIASDQGALTVRGLKAAIEAVTLAGNVDIRDIHGRVSARTGGGEMTFAAITGDLRSLSGGGAIRVESVDGESALQSAGGDIIVGRVSGPLRASTSGNIHVRDAGSAVSVHTAGGLIHIGRARGMVTAENGGGSIVIGSAPGVHAESAGGGIRLKSVSGPVRATTTSGPIVAGFTRNATLATSFLSSGAGDLTVHLPSNLSVTVKALNESSGWLGAIASEFPEIQARQPTSGYGSAFAQGDLNGGGPLLMLSVSRGSIFVKRAR
ncbi:MAG: hypothetical protein C0504_05690 [Candidatus Solibacter sp.]|nr:hypothetical protein [Candidatus Solibacter sp.]